MPQITMQVLFLQMDWTDPESGETHPGALCYPQGTSFDNTLPSAFGSGGSAGVDWHIYKDLDHASTCHGPVGQIHDETPTLEYFAAIQQIVTTGASQAANLGAVLAHLALSHKTVPVMQADGKTPLLDPATNQPVMKSAFDGAQVVVLPVTLTLPGG